MTVGCNFILEIQEKSLARQKGAGRLFPTPETREGGKKLEVERVFFCFFALESAASHFFTFFFLLFFFVVVRFLPSAPTLPSSLAAAAAAAPTSDVLHGQGPARRPADRGRRLVRSFPPSVFVLDANFGRKKKRTLNLSPPPQKNPKNPKKQERGDGPARRAQQGPQSRRTVHCSPARPARRPPQQARRREGNEGKVAPPCAREEGRQRRHVRRLGGSGLDGARKKGERELIDKETALEMLDPKDPGVGE